MKLLTLFLGWVAAQFENNCNNPVVRKEVRELSRTELQIFLNATRTLHSSSEAGGRNTRIHLDYSTKAHGTSAFLPWHRMYLYSYEKSLQEIDDRIVFPYWDWSRDSQSPERSPILGSRYFGGNGRKKDGCLTEGPFANIMVSVPDSHCLCREYDSGELISSFYSPEALEVILSKSSNYEQFRERIEAAPHARVHASLGGSKGDIMTMHSPNDPLFFMHHSFIDLLWQEWQLRNPKKANFYPNPDEILEPFNVSVKEVLDSTQNLCYSYPRYSAKLPKRKIQRRQLFSMLSNVNSGLGGVVSNIVNTVDNIVDDVILSGVNLNELLLVNSLDRTSTKKIRATNPVPESYLKMNNLDVSKCRTIENDLNTLMSSYNYISDFEPQAGLL